MGILFMCNFRKIAFKIGLSLLFAYDKVEYEQMRTRLTDLLCPIGNSQTLSTVPISVKEQYIIYIMVGKK